jgi:hypothetical protein
VLKAAEAAAGVPSFSGGLHDLACKAFGVACPAVPDLARADLKVIITNSQGHASKRVCEMDDGALSGCLLNVSCESAALRKLRAAL